MPAQKIAIASTKGGVGKTTTAISLGHALTNFGREIIVVDADTNRPHVGLTLGYEYTPQSLHHALDGKHSIKQASYLHPSGLRVIPGNIYHDNKTYKTAHLFDLLTDLHNVCEVVLIDTPPAPQSTIKEIFSHCDAVIIVTTPDTIALHEVKQTIKLAQDANTKILGIIINNHQESEHTLTAKNIEMHTNLPVIGIIPHSKDIQQAHAHKHPVTHTHTQSNATIAYKKLAANLIGEQYVANKEKEENESIATHILTRLGFKKTTPKK